MQNRRISFSRAKAEAFWCVAQYFVWLCIHWTICIISLIYTDARNDIRLWTRARHLGLQYPFFQWFFPFHTYNSMILRILDCLGTLLISHYTCLYNLRTCQFLVKGNVIQDICRGLSIGFEQFHLLTSKRRGLCISSSYLTAWPNCILGYVLIARITSAKLYIGLIITSMCMHAYYTSTQYCRTLQYHTIPSLGWFFLHFILSPYTAVCAQCCREGRDAIKSLVIGARPIGMVASTVSQATEPSNITQYNI